MRRASVHGGGRRRRRGRRVYVLSLMLALVGSAASLTARAEAVAPLFADDFESGGLSGWTAVSGLTVQQQHVYAGAWAARGTTSGPGVHATKTLPATQPELFYRTRIKRISLGGTSSVNFMKFRTATGTAIAELYVTPAGLLGYRNDVTATSTNSQTTVTAGVWHEAQMHLRVNGTASTVEVWLDGTRIDALSTTTASLGTTPVGRIQLGENVAGRSYDFAYDDVAADTSYINSTPTTTTLPTTTTEPTTDPVLAAAGDIACDPLNPNFNGGAGTADVCRDRYVSDVILSDANIDAVAALGDNQYYCGGLSAFQQSYDQSWGRVKSITHPAVGNHEYLTSGGTDCNAGNAGAAGYFTYFGAAAGTPGQGWYSFDMGAWHLIALNSNCGDAGGCGTGSPQETWLRNDLASHPNSCVLAFYHIPLWSSGGRAEENTRTLVTDLYNAGAEVILAGHDHIYERFAPQNPSDELDTARGIREFIVGTGGANLTSIETVAPNSEVRNTDTFGVLKLTLHPNSYDWQFTPEPGKTFTDSGSQACH